METEGVTRPAVLGLAALLLVAGCASAEAKPPQLAVTCPSPAATTTPTAPTVPTSAPTAVLTPTPPIAPTPTPAPAWTLVFEDHFDNRTIAEGHFLDGANLSNTSLGALTSDGLYRVYRQGWKDTSGRGTYSPGIISVGNGTLNVHIRTVNGVHEVAAFTAMPAGAVDAKGGLNSYIFEFRARADRMPTYKGVPMLWPYDSVNGEIDGPESNFDRAPKAYVHPIAGVSTGQAFFSYPAGTSWQDWHTYKTVDVPGQYVHYYLDGVLFGSTTTSPSGSAMHGNFQFETNLDPNLAVDPTVSGFVQIDDVRVWTLQ